jgi:eukaryotic-like serine/threonine-protein kinase
VSGTLQELVSILTPGIRFGSYEIVAALGAGGMGEVYRARDLKLGREIAIKLLSSAFVSDPERIARFQREAQVLAALNHPHIAQIHGLDEHERAQFLVLELVDGETLADRIARGPIPVDEALPIAKQIAEAVEAAHEKGIIHRDLKPSNIAFTKDGRVKVLDFGLAKLNEPNVRNGPHAANALAMSATITSPALVTGIGVLLGTAAYMSPEQAKGLQAEKRSDIWAFGCVLYEMLTGVRAFGGDNVSDTLASVLRSSPDWERLPATLPSRIRVVLQRCLQKDRRERLPDIGAARLDIDDAIANRDEQLASPKSISKRRRMAFGVVAGVIATAGAAVGWLAHTSPPPIVSRLALASSGIPLTLSSFSPDVVITPDGERVIYVADDRLFSRKLDQLTPVALTAAVGPRSPFTSPDGTWIGFFDSAGMKKVPAAGGAPVLITRVHGSPRGASWGDDGWIVFAADDEPELQRVNAAGGQPERLTRAHVASQSPHRWPQVLPGSDQVLFTIASADGSVEQSKIAVIDTRSSSIKVLITGGTHARYLRSGHLVYGAPGSLRVTAFDVTRLTAIGSAVPVGADVTVTPLGAIDFDVSATGTLVYVPATGPRVEQRILTLVDRTGHEERLNAPVRAYVYPRISPDGTRVALDVRDQMQDIWVWDLRRQTLSRLTASPGQDSYPVWAGDGRRILFSAWIDGRRNLAWEPADGSGSIERVLDSPDAQTPLTISPDGTRIIFRDDRTSRLMMLSLDNGRLVQLLTQSSFREFNADISPDGRWIAYESDESGRREVYVRPFPNVSAGRWQVSNGGGTRPRWSPRGDELFYLATTQDLGGEAALMSVRVEPGTSLTVAAPTKLFSARYFYRNTDRSAGDGRTYDVMPDGRRFLMIKQADGDQPPATNIVVVQHWFEELRHLLSNK